MAYVIDGNFRINYDNEIKKYNCYVCNKNIKSANNHIETLEHIKNKHNFQCDNPETFHYEFNDDENRFEEQVDAYYSGEK